MPTKHKTEKSVSSNKTWLRWLAFTALKLAFALSFALAIFVIYLDAKVQKTFEGQRWQVPAQIYGQIESLRTGDTIDVNQIKKSLVINGYSKVRSVNLPGQFAQSAHRLIIYRRAFTFPNVELDVTEDVSEAVQLTIDFTDNRVSKLFVEGNAVEQVKLEPILLARLVPDNKEDRVLVALEHMPTLLLDTLLLIEDRDFYHHQGVSPLGILRALYNNIAAGRTVQGGSTLTQQLVKNMFLTRERTLIRKVKEAIMALIIEVRYSKDQLLEAYINEVYLGQHYANGIYGFGLASTFYFDKPLAELNNGQMALLVAQVKGPSYYDPWRHPDRAKKRRDLILRLMFEQNLLSVQEFEQTLDSSLSIRKHRRFRTEKYPAFLQLVKRELNQHLSTYQQKMGIRVFTGFSHVSQQLLEESVATQLDQLEKSHHQKDLQAAMIVTDIASAEIRALVGDRQSGLAGFNRALDAKRPVGSLIKPAIYLAALERFEQFNFASLLADEPITLSSDAGDNGQGKKWQPKNYDGKYRHQVPLIDGLVKSLNIPTVNLGMSLGLENVANAIHLLGFEEDIVTRPSILLGAINMSPMQINQMYLAIANQGELEQVHAINNVISSYGETLWQFEPVATKVISTDAAYLLDYALMQVAITGTAKSLTWRLKNNKVAGKTGTSNDLRDSWFVGFDDKNLVTTWLGKDNNKPTGLTGSSGALLLFTEFIKKQGVVNKTNKQPDTIAMTVFEAQTGNAVTSDCANTATYPAIVAGVTVNENCLKERTDGQSWLEKLFSFTKS
ncbi:penicillin-binding protein 1B [Candidatus Colwellia aromaticivorans]|uniref:penicillin-binding protein 1B n=1 Tax=Candidatus Colwellia aromaticivorans TaxID=2267621 RepID=UPI000DF4AD12|nr:penicillin-binding protein 1B [Candidatus Colwellia aromaticivorans]